MSGGLALDAADRWHPIVEAGPAATTVAFEKRPSGGRTMPAGEDAVAATADYPVPGCCGRAGTRDASSRAAPGGPGGLTFTARSPPTAG